MFCKRQNVVAKNRQFNRKAVFSQVSFKPAFGKMYSSFQKHSTPYICKPYLIFWNWLQLVHLMTNCDLLMKSLLLCETKRFADRNDNYFLTTATNWASHYKILPYVLCNLSIFSFSAGKTTLNWHCIHTHLLPTPVERVILASKCFY